MTGQNKKYSPDQIQSYSKYRGITNANDNDDNGRSSSRSSKKHDSSSDENSAENQGVDDIYEGAAVESNRPQVWAAPVKSGKYLRKMLKVTLT